jgi:hypothetical protein
MTTSEPKRTPRLQLTCDAALKTSLDKIHKIHTGFQGDSKAAAVYAINAFADSLTKAEVGDIPAAYAKFCDNHNLWKKVVPFSLLSLVYGINFNDQRPKSKLWDHAHYWGCSDGLPEMITIEPYHPDPKLIRELMEKCESLGLICNAGKEPSIHSPKTTLITIKASRNRDLSKAYNANKFWLWFLCCSDKDKSQGYQHPVFLEPRMKTFIDDLSRKINHHKSDEDLKLNSLLPIKNDCDMFKDCALVIRQSYLDCITENHRTALNKAYLEEVLGNIEDEIQDRYLSKIKYRGEQLSNLSANRRLVQAINVELRRHGALISPYYDNVTEHQAVTAHTNDELPSTITGAVMISDDYFNLYDGYKLLNYLRARPIGTVDFNKFSDVIDECMISDCDERMDELLEEKKEF